MTDELHQQRLAAAAVVDERKKLPAKTPPRTTPLIVSQNTLETRRAICLACAKSGEVREVTAHCRQKGERDCASNQVVFKTGRDGQCPLGLWAKGITLPPNAIALHATSAGGGMGDTIVALYAIAGLAASMGRPVVYFARWREWIERVTIPGVDIRSHLDYGIDLSGGWHGPHGYNNACKSSPSRAAAYAANIAAGASVPAFAPARPIVDRTIRTLRASGKYAVIAPHTSQWPAREWPAAKWTELARRLVGEGFEVIAVGSPPERDRLQSMLGSITGTSWRTGFPPSHVIDLLLGAAVVVGNDSGIAHLGGLLSVPTVCVHAGSLPHDYLFACAPTVTSVTPTRAVGRSDANAPALATVSVDAVLAACLEAHP